MSHPSVVAQIEIRSSRGSACRSLTIGIVISKNSWITGPSPGCDSCGGPSGEVWPASSMICSDQCRTRSQSSRGYPSRSPIMIAGRRDAIASMASHSPRGATSSRISRVMPRTCSSWLRTAPGVNRRADEVPLLLVRGVVHVDDRPVFALVEVGTRPGERRVARAVDLDRDDVVVARDRPELLHRIPEHRRFLAQPPVRVPRVDVELRVEDVDARRRDTSAVTSATGSAPTTCRAAR